MKEWLKLLISSFRRVLYVVFFFGGNSPASAVYMPTFHGLYVGRYPPQLFLYSDHPLTLSPTLLMAHATSSQTFSLIISHS